MHPIVVSVSRRKSRPPLHIRTDHVPNADETRADTMRAVRERNLLYSQVYLRTFSELIDVSNISPPQTLTYRTGRALYWAYPFSDRSKQSDISKSSVRHPRPNRLHCSLLWHTDSG